MAGSRINLVTEAQGNGLELNLVTNSIQAFVLDERSSDYSFEMYSHKKMNRIPARIQGERNPDKWNEKYIRSNPRCKKMYDEHVPT